MSKNSRDQCMYYSCGAHHTDAPSSNFEIQHFVNAWVAICALHTVQIACRAHVGLRARFFLRNCNILAVRCSPRRWNFEFDLLGPHRANRPRVQSMWCTPLECDSNVIYSVHTVHIAQGCNLCGVHRSNAIYSVHTVEIAQGCNLCELECALRGVHRATRQRGPT